MLQDLLHKKYISGKNVYTIFKIHIKCIKKIRCNMCTPANILFAKMRNVVPQMKHAFNGTYYSM